MDITNKMQCNIFTNFLSSYIWSVRTVFSTCLGLIILPDLLGIKNCVFFQFCIFSKNFIYFLNVSDIRCPLFLYLLIILKNISACKNLCFYRLFILLLNFWIRWYLKIFHIYLNILMMFNKILIQWFWFDVTI